MSGGYSCVKDIVQAWSGEDDAQRWNEVSEANVGFVPSSRTQDGKPPSLPKPLNKTIPSNVDPVLSGGAQFFRLSSGPRDDPTPLPAPWTGQDGVPPSAPPSFHSYRVGDDDLKSRTSDDQADIEKRTIKIKDLSKLRIPALPEAAGTLRSWKNSVVTMLLSFDLSAEGLLNEWLQKGLKARTTEEVEELKRSSGDFPRFDRMMAAALTRPEHLKSIFGSRTSRLARQKAMGCKAGFSST